MECRKRRCGVKLRSKVREEEVKGLVMDRFFKRYDCTPIIENIDFAVKDRASANDRASSRMNAKRRRKVQRARRGTEGGFEGTSKKD
jgi:hypothetical protein